MQWANSLGCSNFETGACTLLVKWFIIYTDDAEITHILSCATSHGDGNIFWEHHRHYSLYKYLESDLSTTELPKSLELEQR